MPFIYPYDGEHKRRAILAIARQCVGRCLPSQRAIGEMIGASQPLVAWHVERLREAELLWLRPVIHGKQRRMKVERVA